MGVKFIGCRKVGMAYHAAEKLRVDACFGGLGDEGMAAVIGRVGRKVQLLHDFLPFPLDVVRIGVVPAIAVYEFRFPGCSWRSPAW